MADFNPSIPNANDPNYFKYSDSISNIKPDTSTGEALSTIGTGITGATKLADQTVKSILDKSVSEQVDKQREGFTSALETVRGGIVPAPAQTASGGSVALSFADSDSTEAPAPAAITSALGKVDAVQSALAAGKVNDTYYTQQLNSISKSLRAQYPGYRDYIDGKIAEMTGVNPANAYIKNLMEDINRQQTSKKTEYDKDLDLARGDLSKLPGANEQFQRLSNDPSYAPKFREWHYEENEKANAIERQNAMRANMKGTKEDIATQRTEDFTKEAGMTVDSNFHNILKVSGMETPAAIMDTVQDMAQNPGKYTEQQMEAFAVKMQAQKSALSIQLKQKSNQLINGTSYASDIGSDKVDNIIKSQLASYDGVIDALKNKDAGAAFYQMNQARAMLDQTKGNLLSNKDYGEQLRNFKTVSDMAGPALGGVFVGKVMQSGLPDRLAPLFSANRAEAIAQPGLDKTGQPVTITQQMGDIKNDKRISPAERAQLFNSMIDITDNITDPKAPDSVKANVIKHLFDPSNAGVLSNFKADYYDPDTKKNVGGKTAVWTRLTKPDVTDNIARIAKSDPEAGQEYANWVKTTGRDLIGQDVRNLNHFTGHDNLSFEWDNKSHQIELKDAEEKPGSQRLGLGVPGSISGTIAPPMDKGYKFQVQQTVKRLNDALKNLSHVSESFGGDTESFLLQTLQDYGLNNEGKVTGLPKSLGDAVAASRKPQKRLDDAFGDTK